MNPYYVQYHSRTLAALTGRMEQQTTPLPCWKLDFPESGLMMALGDKVENSNGIKMHAGLSIIVNLRAESQQHALETSKQYVETILNLISFSALTYCDPARLVSIITILDHQPHPVRYYVYPFDKQEILSATNIVDADLFATVFEAYTKSQYQKRTLRTLTWLRKGIGEEYSTDEFLSYWIGLEVIKHLLRKELKTRMKDPGEWDGVKDVFTDKLQYQGFDDIKDEARNGLVHGFREFDDSFVKEIESHIEPIRKTLVYCLGKILGLDDTATFTIAEKSPRRIKLRPWTVLEGDLANVLPDFSELLGNYPVLDYEITDKKVLIDEKGELNVTFSVNHVFHGPSEAMFKVRAKELWVLKPLGKDRSKPAN